MGKTLIIAEKPSVAADIAKVLPGKFKKTKTHYEGDEHVVSYAIGHLVSIAYPEEVDPVYKKWTIDNLPILPEPFPLSVLPNTKTQFNALVKLIRRRDVEVIVNGCDAGREGELIFKYIMKMAANRTTDKKPIRRLWLQSMTSQAIKEGLANLRDNKEMIPLEDTALCRSEADWLIGINATRALTCYNSRFGGFRKTPCGRVQTPTLSMLVKRETEINNFVASDYFELHAEFKCQQVQYQAIWIDPDFKKNPDLIHGKKERIWHKEQAEEIIKKCRGKEAKVSEKAKKSSQASPPLYDLTLLQREANNRFGFSAKNTLGIAQALYEKHKLITYPRTDSRCLPEDYLPKVKEIFKQQEKWQYGKFALEAREKQYIKKSKRIFNNKKISDHFAIIPTSVLPKSLSEPEFKIYQMIVQRTLAVFFPPALFNNTTRLSVVEEETFLTEGKIMLEPGWKAIYGSGGKADNKDKTLTPLPKGEVVRCDDIELRELQTRPPARFNEATLLSAMEHSGKLIDDEELAEAMKERGLGTPATRAAIIEKLLNEKYICRSGKELVPTGKAFELLNLLNEKEIAVLSEPELTGEWEYKLNQILKGDLTRNQFMSEIKDLTKEIIAKIKEESNKNRKEASFSPVDGQIFWETESAYESEDGRIRIRKVLGGRVMKSEEVHKLIKGETLGPYDNFLSKQGRPFTASVCLDKGKVSFKFAQTDEEVDLEEVKKQEPLGISPVDESKVYDTPAAFMSESAIKGDKGKGLRISKTILGRRIDPDHIVQLLEKGKTELISGFISKRKRPFDAFLVLNENGKLSFEFPPRKGKNSK